MPKLIQQPTRIQAAGNKPKIIEEYIGLINTKTGDVSIAHMKSPPGWTEPGQRPEFGEYTLVLRGALHVKTEEQDFDIAAGQAIFIGAGEWVQYSSPAASGAEYISVCLPAFSPQTVHRDE